MPHLGNLLGALLPWKALQDNTPKHVPKLFFFADLHALTVQYDPSQFPDACRYDVNFFGFCLSLVLCRLSCAPSVCLMLATTWSAPHGPLCATLLPPADVLPAHSGMTASLLACGIDPAQSSVFRQSAVPEHSELCWILTCHTPMGWLQRMTQFKQKGGKRASLGLLSYPVLMAADILLYRGHDVPVGDDQKQHLELAVSIATTFNHTVGRDVFPLPYV